MYNSEGNGAAVIMPTGTVVTANKPLPKRLIGVGMKMYFDLKASNSYITAVAEAYEELRPWSGIFLIPSSPAIQGAIDMINDTTEISIGAQDCHWEDQGAYTGETSPLVLKQLGCKLVELGHAERRRPPINEDDATVAKKAQAAVRNGLIPLVCIGEKSGSRIASEGVGLAVRECAPQVNTVLDAIPEDAHIIFAYEPIWAIGAQEPAGADHVCNVVYQLKRMMEPRERTGHIRVLYGGSAGPGTFTSMRADIDGLFLGRFAHDLEDWKKVVMEVDAGY